MASLNDSQVNTEASAPSKDEAPTSDARETTPVCLVLGMAGSGKTTLVDALSAFIEDPCDEEEEEEEDEEEEDGDEEDEETDLTAKVAKLIIDSEKRDRPATKSQVGSATESNGEKKEEKDAESDVETEAFVVNLDPAVFELPYEANIDIRDTIDYKKVMHDYKLGPNGAIITSLNLYATRFDQVMGILEGKPAGATKTSEKEKEVNDDDDDQETKQKRITIIDTPGQIETFTWSASGTIITDALAHTFPTVVLYVVDSVRAKSPMTFISNMLYACSIMYKTKLPMIVVFNKTDVEDADYAVRWMQDFDEFDRHINDSVFIGDLARSMAMTLNRFYDSMRTSSVSAATGKGLRQLVDNIYLAADEYDKEYKPLLQQRIAQRAQEEQDRQQRDLDRFRQDAKEDVAVSRKLEQQQQKEGKGGRAINQTDEVDGLDPTLRPWSAERDGDDDDDDDDDEDGKVDPRRNLTPEQQERLQKMMHSGPSAPAAEEEDEDDKEEREAYEEYRKYVEAIKGKKL